MPRVQIAAEFVFNLLKHPGPNVVCVCIDDCIPDDAEFTEVSVSRDRGLVNLYFQTDGDDEPTRVYNPVYAVGEIAEIVGDVGEIEPEAVVETPPELIGDPETVAAFHAATKPTESAETITDDDIPF